MRVNGGGPYVNTAPPPWPGSPGPLPGNGLMEGPPPSNVVDVYAGTFLALLAAYVLYSVWAHLDGRLPVGAALLLLLVAALADAAGNGPLANTLAAYVFYLLGAGVFLLLVEHIRESRGRSGSSRPLAGEPGAERRESPDEG